MLNEEYNFEKKKIIAGNKWRQIYGYYKAFFNSFFFLISIIRKDIVDYFNEFPKFYEEFTNVKNDGFFFFCDTQ